MRPIIGITTTNLKALPGIPEAVPDSWVMSQRFIFAPTQAGGLPWLIPLLEHADDLRPIYERLDAIMIPGGADVDPSVYGEERLDFCEVSDPPRDRVELQLIRWALEDGKPVLGICRGIQLINLALGGSLYQGLAEQLDGSVKHDYFPAQGFARDHLSHDVAIEEGTRLAGVFGAGRVRVNSMHHQAIRQLGNGLIVSARCTDDGVIEGVELPGHPFMVGVQWHPEALSVSDKPTQSLFESFVQSARAYREGLVPL